MDHLSSDFLNLVEEGGISVGEKASVWRVSLQEVWVQEVQVRKVWVQEEEEISVEKQ